MKRYPKRGRPCWGQRGSRLSPYERRDIARYHAPIPLGWRPGIQPGPIVLRINSPGGSVADLARTMAPLAHGGPLVQLAIDEANRAEVERVKQRIREMAESGEVYVLPRCGSIGARSLR